MVAGLFFCTGRFTCPVSVIKRGGAEGSVRSAGLKAGCFFAVSLMKANC